jgi:hypothetical protein
MPAITNKVALVMGGASGIGAAIAKWVANEGASTQREPTSPYPNPHKHCRNKAHPLLGIACIC